MKVKYHIHTETSDAFFKAEHKVLAYGAWDENSNIFLLANKELQVIEPYDKNLTITDPDLSDYINYPGLNYGKDFYVQNSFLSTARQFESYHHLKTDSIWVKSKLKNFYSDNGYEFSAHFRDTVLNENYKIGLINGFLLFANHFININNRGISYCNSLHFNIAAGLEAIIPDRLKDEHFFMEQLDSSHYMAVLTDFVKDRLMSGNEKSGDENAALCRQLIELIDSLFMEKTGAIYRIRTFYDDLIAIGYMDKFYYLNYDWNS